MRKGIYVSVFWLLLGVVLNAMESAGQVDEFWGGLGFALMMVGLLQVARLIRYQKDAQYREQGVGLGWVLAGIAVRSRHNHIQVAEQRRFDDVLCRYRVSDAGALLAVLSGAETEILRVVGVPYGTPAVL